jgi:hypothetical protein
MVEGWTILRSLHLLSGRADPHLGLLRGSVLRLVHFLLASGLIHLVLLDLVQYRHLMGLALNFGKLVGLARLGRDEEEPMLKGLPCCDALVGGQGEHPLKQVQRLRIISTIYKGDHITIGVHVVVLEIVP